VVPAVFTYGDDFEHWIRRLASPRGHARGAPAHPAGDNAPPGTPT